MKILSIPFLILFNCSALKAQPISVTDSIEIKSKVEGFYSWYIHLIKTNKVDSEFNPSFVKSKGNMTTLDFTNYVKGLKAHHFTREFIKRKVKEYQPCVNNLKKIPYSTFSTYTDLDQFENIGCAFSNVYEWSGGMESIDEAQLIKVNHLRKGKAEAVIEFFINTPTGPINSGSRTFKLTKDRSGWKIGDMK